MPAAPFVAAVGNEAYASIDTVSSVLVSWPAHQPDDIGLLFIIGNGDGTNSPSTVTLGTGSLNWTTVAGANILNTNSIPSLSRIRGQVHRSRATTSSEPDVEIILPANNTHIVGHIIVVRGCVTTANPIEDVALSSVSGGTGELGIGGVTTTKDNSLLVWLAGQVGDDGAADLFSLPEVTGEVENAEDATAGHGDFFKESKTIVQSGTIPTAGTVSVGLVELVPTVVNAVGITLALNPVVFTIPELDIVDFTPIKDGFTNEQDNMCVAVPLLGGPSRVRQDVDYGPYIIGVQWLFDEEEYTQFMGFVRDDLFNGASSFLFDVITDIGIPTTHRVRFVDNSPRLTKQQGEGYWVSATLEAERNPTFTGLIAYEEEGRIRFNVSLFQALTDQWEPGDLIRIIDSSGTHPTGSTPLNLDGIYIVDSTSGTDTLILDNPSAINSDWDILAGLGVSVEYGSFGNGSVISTITRIPT